MVTATSRRSYREHVIDGKARTQRERILDFLEQHQLPRNRREISLMTGIPINAVCGRVKALLDDGKLEVAYVDVDLVTRKRVEYLDLPTKVLKQGELF